MYLNPASRSHGYMLLSTSDMLTTENPEFKVELYTAIRSGDTTGT